MSAEQNGKINEQVFGRVDALERGWIRVFWWQQWAGSYLAMYPIHSGVSSIYSDFIHCRTERWDEKAGVGWGGSSCQQQTPGDTHTLSYLPFSLLIPPILVASALLSSLMVGKRLGILANLTMPLFLCWSCVCNAFCLGLCVRSPVEVFVVITLEAMASAGNAPCPPQLSTSHQPPRTRIQKGSRFPF